MLAPMHIGKRFILVAAMLFYGAGIFASLHPARADEFVMDQKRLEELINKEFSTMREHLIAKDTAGLKQQIAALTHDKTIFLFEFTSTISGVDFPQQRAYFDRDPFIALLDYTTNLSGEDLEHTYKITKFMPQYGNKEVIIIDEGTASGMFSEPFLKKDVQFHVKQNCRNTVSADSETYFKIDSVYCRMHIEYAPQLDKPAP
jgi:hypothetical protein